MKNKKVICLILSLALILSVSLPGTLAASTDTTGTDSNLSVDTTNTTESDLTISTEDTNNDSSSAEDDISLPNDSKPDLTTSTEDTNNNDNSSAEDDISLPNDEDSFAADSDMTNSENTQVSSDNQIDNNTPNSEIDDTDISVNSELVCSCYTQDKVHSEECPCYKHVLFEKLMACKTLDELFAIIDSLSDDELMSLTDKETNEIEAKILVLEKESLPPVVTEEIVNKSVISKIIYPAINFDNVAPFGAPVVG